MSESRGKASSSTSQAAANNANNAAATAALGHAPRRPAIQAKDIVKQQQSMKKGRVPTNEQSKANVHSSDAAVVSFGIQKSFVLFQGVTTMSKCHRVSQYLKLVRSFHLWNRLCRCSKLHRGMRSGTSSEEEGSARVKTATTSRKGSASGDGDESNTGASVDYSLDDVGRSDWNQHQYISLLAEHEKTRDQLSTLRSQSSEKVRELQQKCARGVIVTWLHARDRVQRRQFFDKWRFFTVNEGNRALLQNQKLQLEVGMQRVQSEREVVKEAEQTSLQLRSSLMCTFFFYKWRSCVQQAMQMEEKKRHVEERQLIKNEIRALREAVQLCNKHDTGVMRTATANGNQVVKSLLMLQRGVAEAVKTHRRNSHEEAAKSAPSTASADGAADELGDREQYSKHVAEQLAHLYNKS